MLLGRAVKSAFPGDDKTGFLDMYPIYDRQFGVGRVRNVLASGELFPAHLAKQLTGARDVCMKDTDVSRCAVPHCSAIWNRMGEGKLFMFHVRTPAPDGTSTKKVWLCENCFDSWDVTLNQDHHPVLSPRQRMAH